MAVRFRIRTSAGQELSFASHEMFEDFVRSGDLAPDDLVYDGETGSWSPARAHPTVLEVEYEKEAAAEDAAREGRSGAADGPSGEGAEVADVQPPAAVAGPESSRPAEPAESSGPVGSASDDSEGVSDEPAAASPPSEETTSDGTLGLDLAPVSDVSPAQAQKAFVEKMAAERQSDVDYEQAVAGLTVEDTSTLGEMMAPAPDSEAPPSSGGRAEKGGSFDSGANAPGRSASSATRTPPRSPGIGRLLAATVVLGILGTGGYLGYRHVEGASPEGSVDPMNPAADAIATEPPPPPAREPVIASTPGAVRERARERYLTATQNALRDLPPVPDVWPHGLYLSTPSDYPEVLDVWQTYLSTISAVRQRDAGRYRTAFEAALDDAVVSDDTRDERLQTGLAAFSTSAPLRAAHFDRVESLASGAIQIHTALLEAEGLILYDAGGSAGGRSGLGAGASGRDPESQLLLDQVLDLVATRLDAGGVGPRTGENVRSWVWDGFLDAVTR